MRLYRVVVLVAAAVALTAAPSFAVAGPSVAARAKAVRASKPRWQTLPMPPAMPKADERGTAEIGGAKIFYAIYGKARPGGEANASRAEHEPVVLLHGGLGNSSHFGFQMPALIDRFQVIAIDSRGQGRSTKGSLPISYDQMARDVIAVLDKLAIPRAAIVGWSDGGEVALKLGIQFPDRVSRLFVYAANYDANGSKPRSGPMATLSGYAARCRSDYERMSRSGLAYNALAAAMVPMWRGSTGITKDHLRAITAPALIADGEHDELIQLDQIVEMSQLIPNAQLKVFEGTSHFSHWQDPETFNRTLVEFLTSSLSG